MKKNARNKNRRQQAPKQPRNEEFAMATITRHAASARKPRLATDYTRKDKSWRKDWS